MKSKVRSVKGKTGYKGRKATPKIAPNKKRNKPPMRRKSRIDAIPASQSMKGDMYAAMKGD